MNPTIRIVVIAAWMTMLELTAVYCQDQDVKHIADKFQDAWNRHDMNSLSELVAEDIDFITVGATWMKGRTEFRERHINSHRVQFKESVLKIGDIEAKSIRPDIAVAHIAWSLRGDRNIDGSPRPPRQGIFTWVLERRKGKWLIIASHNTNMKVPIPEK
jgi:uncharacterized protein (TIGR02246 family)